MSYLRDKSRPQGDRPITHTQDNFGGGLNVDTPATDVDNNEVIGGQNYVWSERYGDGRSGTVEVGTFPAAGSLNGTPVYHPKQKVLLFHKGSKVYRWDGVAAIELLSYPVSGDAPVELGEDSNSSISPFGEDALLFVGSGDIYYLLLKNDVNKFFKINLFQPLDVALPVIPLPGSSFQAPYKYKYAYTFSLIIKESDGTFPAGTEDRLTDGFRLLWESPPVLSALNIRPNSSYFQEIDRVQAITATSTQDIIMGGLDSTRVNGGGFWDLGSVSHISWYRTVDFGQNGIDNENIDQYGWVGDSLINTATPALTLFADGKTDIQVIANNLQPLLRLSNIEWEPLKVEVTPAPKTAAFGTVTAGFVFAANKNGKTLAYSQRVNDALVGFHAGFQSQEFNDGIRVLRGTPDLLTIACNNTTHIATLTSIINAGVLQSDFVLDHFDEIDENIGVQDEGSFVEVEQGTYIALCSDKSVRTWEGNGWSGDRSHEKVEAFIDSATVGLTQAVYSNGAYFLFLDTNASGAIDTTLRLSLKRSSGRGWTTYGGDNWIIPAAAGFSVFNGDNFLTADGIDLNLTFIADANGVIYWMETFNGPMGSSINGFAIRAYFADKVSLAQPNGFNIKCRAKVKEITGSKESFNIIHQESHSYLRDLVDPDKNTVTPPISYPALKVDARAFVDGSLTPIETEGEVNPGDDIQFWYRVEGSRISIEFEANRSGHQIRRNDSRFRVQDILRPGRAPANNISATFQDEFQTGLALWMATRPNALLDRVARAKLSSNGVTLVTAPDNRNKGLSLTGALAQPAPYIKSNTTVFDAFTYNVWIKTPVLSGAAEVILFKANGVQPLTITLNFANLIETVEFGGGVAVDDPTTAPGNLNGWSQFIFVRQASDEIMNVYQNDALKGTLPVTSSFGGGALEIGGVV